MKQYPSITLVKPGSPPGEHLHTFDKLDGSNLRFEWARKKGWWKSGTRKRLFDETDDMFADGEAVFANAMGEKLARYGTDERLQKMVVFVEYHGPRSFAGLHHPEDVKVATLLDLTVENRGFVGPTDYLRLVEKHQIPAPRYLGYLKWNETLLRDVEAGALAGMTFEGIVGKMMERKRHMMWKAKTEAWRAAVRDKFEHAKALELLES